jgi:ribonuclease R
MLSPEEILKILGERSHHPASARDLMQAMRVPREERATFRRALKALVASGRVVRIRGIRYGLPEKMDLVVGRLQTHPNGYGFVIPESRPRPEDQPDIYVAGPHLKEAIHGDRVVVRLEQNRTGFRPEGRIVQILEHDRTTIVGRFGLDSSGHGAVVPFDPRILTTVRVPPGEAAGVVPGHMVGVEITRWPTATADATGHIIEVFGDAATPGVDTLVVLRKYGIPDAHGEAALREASSLLESRTPSGGEPPAATGREDRTDFRGDLVVTIDGEHARDFDDAVAVERLPGGHFRLGVHIADVSHYVHEGSALDEEAYDRGTSVYFPDRAVHMFPEVVATDLCSLRPRVDRLVHSCVMEIDSRGELVRYDFHDGVINTAARMTYTEVNAILTDRDAETSDRYRALIPTFELMREVFETLNARRRRLGSIDFDLEEPELILDEAGLVEAVVASERNVAHRIIEEFMLRANEAVARHLHAQGIPAVYRVHERPDPRKVDQFEAFISPLGFSLGVPADRVEPRHFQRLVERVRGRPEEKPIALLMLRTMQRARYAEESLGHFGLAFPIYTHFTSPIRRYPDLIVHRLLREVRGGPVTARRRDELAEELPEAAAHLSEMERRAADAERELVEWKKVRFMADKVGDEYDAYIVGVTPFGLFVQLVEPFVEGLVHVSSMGDDYYRYVEATRTLRGRDTGRTYRLGDRARVQVLRVDLERRQIELGLVDILDAMRGHGRKRRVRRARTGPGGPGRR